MALFASVDEYFSASVHGFHAGMSVKVPCDKHEKCFSAQAGYSREAGYIQEMLHGELNLMAYGLWSWLGHNISWGVPSFGRPLDGSFLSTLEQLPTTLDNSTLGLYNLVVQNYGTSVIDEITTGGYEHVTQTVSASFSKTVKLSWVLEQAGLTFQLLTFGLGISQFHNRSQIHINETWMAKVENASFASGGNQSLFHPSGEGLGAWKKSVYGNPLYVTAGVSNLTLAFPAKYQAQAAAYQAVVNYYLATGQYPTSVPDLRAVRMPEGTYPLDRHTLCGGMADPTGCKAWVGAHPEAMRRYEAEAAASWSLVHPDSRTAVVG